ncbi:PRR35 protein, partial [Polyodon spathula]|nr:PRR35 protein [Polyodon spathula]
MPKEDLSCKISSVYKHKERKPKKPHYIPRPWGKPYNYKCFQCPFTCMEKSHLYNHMKYSLCKNSLSLLIESDWPYKKGNILQPDQLCPLPPGTLLRGRGGAPTSKEDQEEPHKQWRLLATRHRKSNPEGSLPCPDGGSIPCYPPPPTFADCQDPSRLNLSVLGVSYPLSPGLFSYSNPTVAHAQLAPLPFLASAAQLMQTNMEPNPPPTFPSKIRLWKVPTLRPTTATAIPHPAVWSAHHQVALSSEAGYSTVEEKLQAPGKAGSWSHKAVVEVTSLRKTGSKRIGVPLESEETPLEKKSHLGCTLDLLKNLQGNPTFSTAAGQLFHSSFQTALHKSLPPEQLYPEHRKYQAENQEKATLHPRPLSPLKSGKAVENGAGRRDKLDKSAVLLGDLSKALQEYQEAERKIANLVQDNVPGQRYLIEHLCKIRSELSHIHQALEKTTRQPEGPLDLSVKKTVEPPGADKDQQSQGKGCLPEETEEEEEEKAVESESEGLPQKSPSQSLKLMIKMSRASELSLGAVVKTEVVSPSELRPPPPEVLWSSRTTKCEADSSVLLCADGRSTSLVFTEFTPCSKRMKRPSSRDLSGETLCPHNPLSADP